MDLREKYQRMAITMGEGRGSRSLNTFVCFADGIPKFGNVYGYENETYLPLIVNRREVFPSGFFFFLRTFYRVRDRQLQPVHIHTLHVRVGIGEYVHTLTCT